MLKNVWQAVVLILIISVLSLLQNSFISALPKPFSEFNLILNSLIFVLFFLDYRISLLAVFIAGLFLDLSSFNFFGFHLLILFLTLLSMQGILKNWLTNRSLYTLITLVLSATFIYNFLGAVILYLSYSSGSRFFLWQSSFWTSIFQQIIGGLLFTLILFNLSVFVFKRIKPFFLRNKSLYDTI